jgi:hypothetical protein
MGETTVDRGDPVWAPQLRPPPAKTGKSKAGVLSGADFGSLFARAAPNDLPNLAKSNFNLTYASTFHSVASH